MASLIGLAILTYNRNVSGKKINSDTRSGGTRERQLGAPATADGGGPLLALEVRLGS